MKTGMMCNLIGTAIVVLATIIHIICIATPYYSVADFSKIKNDMKGKDLTQSEIYQLTAIANSGVKIHFGLWQLCYTSPVKEDCKMWFQDIEGHSLDPGVWMRGAQSMATLGAIILGKCAVGTILNLVVESRGDRKRLLPFIICGFCFAGGFFVFVGEMIMATNHKSATNMPNDQPLTEGVKDVLRDEFSLGWGFDLDILPVIMSCICGVLHLVARRFDEPGSGLI